MCALDHGISIFYFLLTSKLDFSPISIFSSDSFCLCLLYYIASYHISDPSARTAKCIDFNLKWEIAPVSLYAPFFIMGLLIILIIILNANWEYIAKYILESFFLCWFLRVNIWCIVLQLWLSCYLKGFEA